MFKMNDAFTKVFLEIQLAAQAIAPRRWPGKIDKLFARPIVPRKHGRYTQRANLEAAARRNEGTI